MTLGLMNQIESCEDVARKKELYLILKDTFLPHMEGEEQSLYLKFGELHDEEAEELAYHADEENEETKKIFSRLDNIGIENDEWSKNFRRLKKAIEKHVEEVEGGVFTEAKEDFSQQELAEMGEEFEEVKNHIIQ